MAISWSAYFTAVLNGLQSGAPTITTPTITGTSSPGYINNNLSLSSGDNTISIQSGTTFVVFVLPASLGGVTVKWKGPITGNTGTDISVANGTYVMMPKSSETQFVINASGTLAGCTVAMF